MFAASDRCNESPNIIRIPITVQSSTEKMSGKWLTFNHRSLRERERERCMMGNAIAALRCPLLIDSTARVRTRGCFSRQAAWLLFDPSFFRNKAVTFVQLFSFPFLIFVHCELRCCCCCCGGGGREGQNDALCTPLVPPSASARPSATPHSAELTAPLDHIFFTEKMPFCTDVDVVRDTTRHGLSAKSFGVFPEAMTMWSWS